MGKKATQELIRLYAAENSNSEHPTPILRDSIEFAAKVLQLANRIFETYLSPERDGML
jgi:hypothetical protein